MKTCYCHGKTYGRDTMLSGNEVQMCVDYSYVLMGKDIYVNEDGEKINELFGLEGSCWFPFFPIFFW